MCKSSQSKQSQVMSQETQLEESVGHGSRLDQTQDQLTMCFVFSKSVREPCISGIAYFGTFSRAVRLETYFSVYQQPLSVSAQKETYWMQKGNKIGILVVFEAEQVTQQEFMNRHDTGELKQKQALKKRQTLHLVPVNSCGVEER